MYMIFLILLFFIFYAQSSPTHYQTTHFLNCQSTHHEFLFNLTDIFGSTPESITVQLHTLTNGTLPVGMSIISADTFIDIEKLSDPQSLQANKMDQFSIALGNKTQTLYSKVDDEILRVVVVWIDIQRLMNVVNIDRFIQGDQDYNCMKNLEYQIQVKINEPISEVLSCQNGGIFNQNKCQCSLDYIGKFCEVNVERIQQAYYSEMGLIKPNQKVFYLIDLDTQQIEQNSDFQESFALNIQMSIKRKSENSNSQLYLLWTKVNKQLPHNQMVPANIFNQGDPSFIEAVPIDPHSQALLLTIYYKPSHTDPQENFTLYELSIKRKYSTAQKLTVIGISVGVSFGMLLLLIVLFYCMYCRQFRIRNWVSQPLPAWSYRNRIFNDPPLDLDFYFPEIQYTFFMNQVLKRQISQEQSSNIDGSKENNCAICLQQFNQSNPQKIRYTFCNHIFHSLCLVSWFQRQQNCPLCREEFTVSKAKEWDTKTAVLQKSIKEKTYKRYRVINKWHRKQHIKQQQDKHENPEECTNHNIQLRI